ncbi:sensor histidine kinase [Phenylobacterium sp.]|uniref:sensor histidine kinase n=1 Tax=Phenylobacterium sp. TaxID=1871053 RepID=UPI0035B3512B
MIGAVKAFAKRRWPRLRLRVILFTVLFFAAAMPGLSAIFLRVYENTLVRQTEAELVAQGAALAAMAEQDWPGAPPLAVQNRRAPGYYDPEPTTIDLQAGPVLEERPRPTRAADPDPAAAVAAARLQPVIDRTVQTTLSSVLLLDGRGNIAGGGGSLGALPEVRAALAGEPRTVLRRNGDYHPRYRLEWLSRASGVRLHHARPVMSGERVVGVVLLSRSPRALFRGIYEDRGKIALGVAGIFSILIIMTGLVSRGVTRPIEALSEASRNVAVGAGGEVPETPTTAAVEIQSLYEDFRAMAGAIERRSGYLRDFAAAVSHEFKTPLAGVTGAVELLQDHGDAMTAQERRRFLDNIAADAARLSQLVTRLLDLARADMARPEAGVATDLEAVLRQAADAMQGETFTVEVAVAPGLPPVAAPAATLEAVLGVLLQNSRQAGARRARLSARAQGGRVLLEASDDGPGVAEPERLFEPFFTTRRMEGGTGLGLSIARSLLAANHATIDLAQAEPPARFVVTLPAA